MPGNVGILRTVLSLLALLVVSVTAYAQDPSSSSSRSHRPTALARSPKDIRVAESGSSAPPAEEYVVGESDILRISVWKEPELSQTVVVRPDGKISLPLVDEVRVSGMTPPQIDTLLRERLKSYMTDPQVTATVLEIRSKMVYITGEVGKPGAYPLLAPLTVLQLIAKAGGLNQFADRKGIFILRNVNGQQTRYPFDYREVTRGRKTEQDILLRAGDTVVVR